MRQQGYSSLASNSHSYGLETSSIAKMMDYNYGVSQASSDLKHATSLNVNYDPKNNTYLANAISNYSDSYSSVDSKNYASYITNKLSVSATSDSKFQTNPFKSYLVKANTSPHINSDDLPTTVNNQSPAINKTNSSYSYKFKDLKSSNLNFLSSDKNVRNLDQISLSKNNINMISGNNNLSSLVTTSINSSGDSSSSEFGLYEASTTN
jgi:hypothetical protein